MLVSELLTICAALAAPAFFLFFGLAALGSPLLAVICLIAGQMRGTQHPEAYARRLLHMALLCALPMCLLLFAASGLILYRVPWLLDWLWAAQLPWALLALALLAYCVSLVVWRSSRSTRRARTDSPLAQALSLAALAMAVLWLMLSLLRDLTAQVQAVLSATPEGGLAVVPLLKPDLLSTTPLLWAAVLAAALACAMCAGAWSLEYLMLRRDREPFGREAFAHAMRLASRSSLRAGLLSLSFLPVLWDQLTNLPRTPADAQTVKVLLLGCGAGIFLACIAWLLLARSSRPRSRPMLVHGSLALVWLSLTLALSAALLRFYAG